MSLARILLLKDAMNSRRGFSAILSASVFFLACCGQTRPIEVGSDPAPSPPVERSSGTYVDVCDLLRSPEKYENEPVRFKAYFCDCFENQNLYSAKCEIDKKIWVQGSLREKCKDAGRIDPFRSTAGDDADARYGAWTFGLTGQGRLIGAKGGYGHMNRFDYLFEIECLDHAELFDQKGLHPRDMAPQQQQKVAVFEAMK